MSHRFKKRERTQNWSPEEKILLLKLCEDRLDVLESKRGDQISIAKKANAWKEIRAEFVAALSIERDVSRLKEQWQRMKCQARADLQDFAMRLKKYGPDIANQKRPNQMSAEVWRVMESARKYFLHMNGNESEEDASTKEINWSLSEANCAANSPSATSECDTAPSLLCETEVRTNVDDIGIDTSHLNGSINFLHTYQFNGLLTECPSPGGMLTEQAKLDYYAKRDYVLAALSNAQQQQQRNEEVDTSRTDNRSPDSHSHEKPADDDDDVVHSLAMFFESKKLEQHKRLQLMDEQMKTAKIYRETAEIQKQIAQQQLKNALIKYNKERERNTKPSPNSSQMNDTNCRSVASSNKDDDEYEEESRKRLKEDIKEKLFFHEEQIQFHQDAINRHKQRLLDIE